MDLNNKVALITGGARMGQAVAEALAMRGCDVALTYRSSKRAAFQAAQQVSALGRKSYVVGCDLTNTNEVKLLIKKVIKRFGRLDVMVNMASIYENMAWSRLDEKKWTQIMNANLKSSYLTVLYGAKWLERSRGRVINFSDWLAESGRPRYRGYAPYYTAKRGVLGLTEAQALELAPKVLVNAIAPGPILPPADLPKRQIKDVIEATPLRRWGGAEEIAKAVVFLAETDFITGECLRVDGGRHLF